MIFILSGLSALIGSKLEIITKKSNMTRERGERKNQEKNRKMNGNFFSTPSTSFENPVPRSLNILQIWAHKSFVFAPINTAIEENKSCRWKKAQWCVKYAQKINRCKRNSTAHRTMKMMKFTNNDKNQNTTQKQSNSKWKKET